MLTSTLIGFAQRVAPDAELRRQRRLVRQDGMLAEVAPDDAGAERIDDVVVEIGPPQDARTEWIWPSAIAPTEISSTGRAVELSYHCMIPL